MPAVASRIACCGSASGPSTSTTRTHGRAAILGSSRARPWEFVSTYTGTSGTLNIT